jgi:DNA-binding IclR family transcriptional regulator
MEIGKPKTENGAGPRAIARVLRLFEALADEPRGRSLSDLGGRLKEPKSTLLNSLRALESDGFLSFDDTLYRLGPKAFRLASQITNGWSLVRAMRGPLRELADRSEETALLSILEPGQKHFVHIDAIEARQRIRYVPSVGAGGPLYATASGRVLLAFQPPDDQDAYIAGVSLTAFTAATTVDEQLLRAQLEEVRRDRVWVSVGEIHVDGGAIAAPVFGPDGTLVAAISIALPLSRLLARRQELTYIVADVAAHASGQRDAAADEFSTRTIAETED